MAQENNIAQQLNDLLVTRNFHPDMRDSQGKVCDSSDAKVFTFDYVSGTGKDYGTMVIILDSGNDLKAMFGNNLGRGMEDADKDEWYEFQQQLSQFANSHRWTYTGDDISKLKYTMQGLAAIKEGLFEGYYGTRRISYAGEPTQARLMIRHNRNLGENDARFRYVESIFVETADGERYRLPFTNLAGGRAMLEHVRQGGKPYDVRGNHICEMITELKVLARFNRASQGRVVEGVKQSVVQGAQTYYKSLRENIKRLSSPRGYSAYFESWHPASITEQDQLVEDIKTLFVEQTIDDRIEQALPLLAKIQQGREMKEAEIFENWVNNVTEGTWSLPETPEQMTKLKELMSGELIVGPDGTNATEQLYDLIGDDTLFDRIDALAAQDPRANVWDDTEIQARLQELGVQMPDNSAPDTMAQTEQPPVEPGMSEDKADPLSTRPGMFRAKADMDNRMTTAGQPTSGEKRIQSYLKHTMQRTKKQGGLSGPKGNLPEDTMAEADNIAAFESLQRMRHLSGMKLEENVLNDAGSTLAHIMTSYQRDVRDFAQTGEMSSDLYDALYDYYFDDMPYGVKKARSGDPYEWIGNRFAEDILSNAPIDENLGGIVGETIPAGPTLTETQCNSTMEGHFCPVHGLSECWSQGMYEDILSTGIQLSEDMTDVGDVVGQATRSAHDWLGQEANNIYKPIGNFIKGVKQGWNGKAQAGTPQTTAAVARPVQSPDITTRDLPGEPGFYAPNGAYIVNGREIPRIEVTGPSRTHDDPMDEASMMNPEIPSDFGSDSHLRDLLKLSGAYRAGDRSALDQSNRAMLARMTRQDPPTVAPSFGTPGAAHAGQGGSDYQDEEPRGQAHAGQGGYNYGDEAEPNDRRMNDADWIMSQNLDEPKGQAHSGQQGYDYQDEPDQSDAETSRLNRAGNSVDLGLPPGQLDKNAWDDMMKTVPALDKNAWNDLVRGNVSEADAPVTATYESREGDALLARIKSLALIR